MSTAVECRQHCGHKPFKNHLSERMHFHRVHSMKIIPMREGKQEGKLVKIDRRTKEWRMAHPHEAKPLGPQDAVARVLNGLATRTSYAIHCVNCHYDLAILLPSKFDNRVCPGCGTPIANMVEQLKSVLKA